LTINGQEVTVTPNGVWQHQMRMQEGENEVYIKAESQNGEITVDTLRLLYEAEQLVQQRAPRRYLLAIAINDYSYESWNRLKMPVKDARDFQQVLGQKYNFNQVDTLFNHSATFANVKDAFKSLIGKTLPQDEVVVFFAGHGEYDETFDEDGKWILHNGRLGNASLATVIEKIPAQHVLVVADACFAGSFYLKRGDEDAAVAGRNKSKSRWVLASGGVESVLDQMPGKQNSPFAWHLIDFLQDAQNDVPLSELRDHLQIEIPKITEQQPISGPIRGDEGGEMILRVN